MHLGKTLLFTDRTDWTDEQIVAAYRSQVKIEDAFWQMKDAHFVSSRPWLHWTEPKIRVHAAYRLLALFLSSLLLREVHRAGINVGMDSLLEPLPGIKGVIHLPRQGSRNTSMPVAIRLIRREAEQAQMLQLPGLQRFQAEPHRAKKGAPA